MKHLKAGRGRRVGVTGCRPPPGMGPSKEHDTAIYHQILDDVLAVVAALPVDTVLVHGDAAGVDRAAANAARGRGLVTEPHPPDYKAYKASQRWRAPLDRNVYVETCHEVIAWPAPWSRGTHDAISKARRAEVPVDERRPWKAVP